MEQFNSLKKYLDSFLSIPPSQWLHFVTRLGIRKIDKDSDYFQQGQAVDEIGFVVKGLFHNFYTDADGNKYVKNFVKEGNPVSCYSDLILKTPASFTSRALEPSFLLTLKYAELLKLYDEHPCWERMGRISAERLFVEKETRERYFLSFDAKARYELFAKENPELHARVPQYLIASYLGISPVTLSRIRNG